MAMCLTGDGVWVSELFLWLSMANMCLAVEGFCRFLHGRRKLAYAVGFWYVWSQVLRQRVGGG